jgi:hypothetical protein
MTAHGASMLQVLLLKVRLSDVLVLLLHEEPLDGHRPPHRPYVDAAPRLLGHPIVKPLFLFDAHVDGDAERPALRFEVLAVPGPLERIPNLASLRLVNPDREKLHLEHVYAGRVRQAAVVSVDAPVSTHDTNPLGVRMLRADEVARHLFKLLSGPHRAVQDFQVPKVHSHQRTSTDRQGKHLARTAVRVRAGELCAGQAAVHQAQC